MKDKTSAHTGRNGCYIDEEFGEIKQLHTKKEKKDNWNHAATEKGAQQGIKKEQKCRTSVVLL